MANVVRSISGARIRLEDERWEHVVERHPEMEPYRSEVIRTLSNPEFVVVGSRGSLLAVAQLEDHRYLVVAYRQEGATGFVTTAYITSRIDQMRRKTQLWPPR